MEDICGVKDILSPVGQKIGIQNNLELSSQGTNYYSFSTSTKAGNLQQGFRLKLMKMRKSTFIINRLII
jgi:hypothetical protein